MTAATGTFVVADPNRSAKGRRWTRALQRQIQDVWLAALETDTVLCRDHGMEAECELMAISTAFAVTAVRVIDLEVLQAEHGAAYLDAKRASDRGCIVDGLTLIRNAEIHMPVVLDPDPEQVISLYDGTQTTFRVLPRWKAYRDLPIEVRTSTKTAARCHRAYESHVEGRKLVDTLLDALSWIVECDPSLGHRDALGDLSHFPLPEQVSHGYERRHPEWQTEAEFDRALRVEASNHLPLGDDRVIQHRLDDVDGNTLAYCGFGRNPYRHSVFTEDPTRIAIDIEGGFTYYFCNVDAPLTEVLEGDLRRVDVADGRLLVDGTQLEGLAFRDFVDAEDEQRWRGWLLLASEDAHHYVQQRQGAG